MKDFENNKSGEFENEWQSAFEDAEVQPSSSLWEKIDYQLTKQENSRFRKRLFFYRLVAGISLIAMAGLGIYSLDLFPGNSSDSIAGQQTTAAGPGSNNTNNEANESGNTGQPGGIKADSTLNNADRQQNDNKVAAKASDNNQKGPDNAYQAQMTIQSEEKQGRGFSGSASEKPEIPERITNISYDNNAVFEKLPEVKKTIYRVPDPTFNERKNDVKFLAGLNVSPDFFIPGYSSKSTNEFESLRAYSSENIAGTTDNLETYLNQRKLQEKTFSASNTSSQITYGMENSPKLSASYGIDLGLKLNKKWRLNSGLNYKQLVASTSTSATWSKDGSSQKIPLTVNNENTAFNPINGKIEIHQNQSVNNAFDFLNIPLNLGYSFDFHPITFEINSGIGANLLIANYLSGNNANSELTKVSLKPGDNNPFRRIYLNSQISGSIGYNVWSNYSVHLTPYYNLSLTTLTTPESNFTSRPRYYGVQFGIKYEF